MDMPTELLSLLSQRRYKDSSVTQIGNHNVYILGMSDGSTRCAKILYNQKGSNYEDTYKDLEYLGLVPRLFEYVRLNKPIRISKVKCTVDILVNQYVEDPSSIDTSIAGTWAMSLIDSLHSNRYIHGDITEPNNIVMDPSNKRALFIDIDTTFHISNIGTQDIDFENEYGTSDPYEIMAFEKRVIEKRYKMRM